MTPIVKTRPKSAGSWLCLFYGICYLVDVNKNITVTLVGQYHFLMLNVVSNKDCCACFSCRCSIFHLCCIFHPIQPHISLRPLLGNNNTKNVRRKNTNPDHNRIFLKINHSHLHIHPRQKSHEKLTCRKFYKLYFDFIIFYYIQKIVNINLLSYYYPVLYIFEKHCKIFPYH